MLQAVPSRTAPRSVTLRLAGKAVLRPVTEMHAAQALSRCAGLQLPCDVCAQTEDPYQGNGFSRSVRRGRRGLLFIFLRYRQIQPTSPVPMACVCSSALGVHALDPQILLLLSSRFIFSLVDLLPGPAAASLKRSPVFIFIDRIWFSRSWAALSSEEGG